MFSLCSLEYKVANDWLRRFTALVVCLHVRSLRWLNLRPSTPPVLLGRNDIRSARMSSVDTSVGVGIDTMGAGRVSTCGEGCFILSVSKTTVVCSIMVMSNVMIRTAAATSPAISLELTVRHMFEALGVYDVGLWISQSLLSAKRTTRGWTVAVMDVDRVPESRITKLWKWRKASFSQLCVIVWYENKMATKMT